MSEYHVSSYPTKPEVIAKLTAEQLRDLGYRALAEAGAHRDAMMGAYANLSAAYSLAALVNVSFQSQDEHREQPLPPERADSEARPLEPEVDQA